MIRVIVDHQLKDKKHTEELIGVMKQLTGEAIKQPGYIIGETLVSSEDECNILVIATWRSAKHFNDWYSPEMRQKVESMYPAILTELPRIRIFNYVLERRGRVWSTF